MLTSNVLLVEQNPIIYFTCLGPVAHSLNKLLQLFFIFNLLYLRLLLPPGPLRNWFPCHFMYTGAVHSIWEIEFVQYICIWLKQTKNIECTFYTNFYFLFSKELGKILAKCRWRTFPRSSHSWSTGFTVLLCPVGLSQNGHSGDFPDSDSGLWA